MSTQNRVALVGLRTRLIERISATLREAGYEISTECSLQDLYQSAVEGSLKCILIDRNDLSDLELKKLLSASGYTPTVVFSEEVPPAVVQAVLLGKPIELLKPSYGDDFIENSVYKFICSNAINKSLQLMGIKTRELLASLETMTCLPTR